MKIHVPITIGVCDRGDFPHGRGAEEVNFSTVLIIPGKMATKIRALEQLEGVSPRGDGTLGRPTPLNLWVSL